MIPTRPIVDLDLARRIERAEGMANAACVDARRERSPLSGACWIDVGGTLAMFDGPESPLTQTFGIGLSSEGAAADLEQLESFFETRAAPVHHEVCPLVDVNLQRMLVTRGYQPLEWSNVLIRPLDSNHVNAELPRAELQVRLIRPDEWESWARLSVRGWNQGPALDEFMFEMLATVARRQGSLCFVAEWSGQPIASGGLFVHDRVALFAGASTVPEARRRGAQRALFAVRLQYAASIGCDLAVVVTLPGSESDRNAQKSGFQTAYTRTKWLLPKGTIGR